MFVNINSLINQIKKNDIVFEDYNGWSNHDTWDLNLHLNNEYTMYILALDYSKESYEDFIYLCLYYIYEYNQNYNQEYGEDYFKDIFAINFKEIYDYFKE